MSYLAASLYYFLMLLKLLMLYTLCICFCADLISLSECAKLR